MKVRNKHGVPHWSHVFGALPAGEFDMEDVLAQRALEAGLVEAAAILEPEPAKPAIKPKAVWKQTPPKDDDAE